MDKQKYWRNSLIVFIVFLGVILFKESLPFLAGVLGAFTMYMLVRKQMFYLTEKKHMKKPLVAILLLLEVVLCILIPTFLVIWLLLKRMEHIEINPNEWIASVQHLVDFLQKKIGYDLLDINNIQTVTAYVTKGVRIVIGEISSFVMNAVVLLFILYFMLISGRQMEAYIADILPFSDINKRSILNEVHLMTVSNAIGVPLLGVIQGAVALGGYLIFDVPNALLFGFVTCFATVIPIVGTAIIWIPLCIFLAIKGEWGNAIGLALFCLIIMTNVDNLLRFVMQKKMANTHPLITIFGVIIGLSLFGFWGVIFGPLLLSMFFLCVDIFKRQYLDNEKKLDLEKQPLSFENSAKPAEVPVNKDVSKESQK